MSQRGQRAPRSNSNKRKKPKGRAQSEALLQELMATAATVCYQPKGMAFADRQVVQCRYNDTNNGQFTNAAAVYASRRWRLNSAYDPDPNLGSGSTAGFTEWAALYNRYIVREVHYDICVCNKETTFPIQVILAPVTSDVGQNYSSIDELQELPYAKNGICSISGGQDRIRFVGKVSLTALRGNALSWMTDPQYSAATNANPSTMYYLNVGGFALGGTFTGLGMAMTARLTYVVEFYDRKNIFA